MMQISAIKDFVWHGVFDVIVIGFGGAGATAARFAADQGSEVLLLDVAPAGHEGGNTRYCGQLIGGAKDAANFQRYYEHLAAPFKLDQELITTFTKGVSEMENYLSRYLSVTPFSFQAHRNHETVQSVAADFPDYPEYPGADAYDLFTVHAGRTIEDGAFWTQLRAKVLERLDRITIWYSSRAIHLMQDETGAVAGVQVERSGRLLNLFARQGVVLTAGGFENDQTKIQDNLGIPQIVPMGTLYNRGDSIRLSQEVGADQWHNTIYNSGGIYHGLTYAVSAGERGRLTYTWPELYTGGVFVIGADGTRYFNEAEHSRAGYLFRHGAGRHPTQTTHSWIIFDEHQLAKINTVDDEQLHDALSRAKVAESAAKLAEQLGIDPITLSQTIREFNEQATLGHDYAYGRPNDTMVPISGQLYAVKLQPAILNTQGGPRRNEQAQILDSHNQPIPRLYGAGEAGSITVNQYQAGQDLAELLIFGKIAGDNVAQLSRREINEPVRDSGGLLESDEVEKQYETGPNQYLGVSTNGMGNKLVVRVTVEPVSSRIMDVEVLEQSETENIGQSALQILPKEVVAKNSANVDGVTGASTTVTAFKEAVGAALEQVVQKTEKEN